MAHAAISPSLTQMVKATNGENALYSIGAGYNGSCGTVIVNGEEEIDLSTVKADYIAHNGEPLTGTLGANVKVFIADSATITLSDVTINGAKNSYGYNGQD